jgi:hypothetical protein
MPMTDRWIGIAPRGGDSVRRIDAPLPSALHRFDRARARRLRRETMLPAQKHERLVENVSAQVRHYICDRRGPEPIVSKMRLK